MNDVKTLKIALVAVIVASATFIGYSWYRQQQMQRNFDDFSFQMTKIQNGEEAADAVYTYLNSNNAGLSAQSADAGLFGWFKKTFGGGRGSSNSNQEMINRIWQQKAEDLQTSQERLMIEQ